MKRIKSIEIRNSAFFKSDFKIIFSEKLNCVMGGRGTGKSTILHFIRAALTSEDQLDEATSKLLRANLLNGTILVKIEGIAGKEITATKTFGTDSLVTIEPGGTINIDELAEYIHIDVYPALAIEDIGRSSQGRLDLIDKPIRSEVQVLRTEISELQLTLSQNADSLRSESKRVLQYEEKLSEYATAPTELKKWKGNKLDDVTEIEREEFEKADERAKGRSNEKRYIKTLTSRLEALLSGLNEFDDETAKIEKINQNASLLLNQEVIAKAIGESAATLAASKKSIGEVRDRIEKAISVIDGLTDPLKALHDVQDAEFIKLKQKLDHHAEYLAKYAQLSKRVQDAKILKEELKEIQDREEKLQKTRTSLISSLNIKKKELFSLRKKAVDVLNTRLEGHVKITLAFGGITEAYADLVRNALRGSNLRYNAIVPYIVENLSPDSFAKAVHTGNYDSLRKVAKIDEERSKAIIDALAGKREIYEIEGLYCEDLPEFYLKVDARHTKIGETRDQFRRSDDLSTGQRCTAVLPIIFAVSDNPLIIDQPEDNLDNEFINNTVRKIVQDQKLVRQLIFITHNPNIPVVSGAEHNIFLHYDEKQSSVDRQGSVEDVRESILKLLEGGEEAFKKRTELYHIV